MNTSMIDLFALVLLLLLVVIFPLIGIWDFRRLVRWIQEGRTDARVHTYNWILVMEWGVTIGLLAWWFIAGRDIAPLGFIFSAGGWQWLAVGVGLILSLFMLFQMSKVVRSHEELKKLREQMGDLGHLAPQTPEEDRKFVLVSITAGICEEMIYRGLLMAVLVPIVGTWPAVALSSVIFGLGHVYQGLVGVGKTTLVGLVMALLTVFSGSVFTAIILHAVIDMTSGRMMGAALRDDSQA